MKLEDTLEQFSWLMTPELKAELEEHERQVLALRASAISTTSVQISNVELAILKEEIGHASSENADAKLVASRTPGPHYDALVQESVRLDAVRRWIEEVEPQLCAIPGAF